MNPRKAVLDKLTKSMQVKCPPPFNAVDMSAPIFKEDDGLLAVQFAEKTIAMGSVFYYCENESRFYQEIIQLAHTEKWENIHCCENNIRESFLDLNFRKIRPGRNLESADASITLCDALVADRGGMVFSKFLNAPPSFYFEPSVHIVLAYTSQIVTDMSEAVLAIDNKYGTQNSSGLITICGPSQSKAVEGETKHGIYGPKAVHVFLIED